MKKLNLPLSAEQRDSLKAGEMVLLSGVMYTARDAAHKRLIEMLDRGETLPLPLVDQTIYYVGPTPAPQGHVYGSAGPTTSMRMDGFVKMTFEQGIVAMIGKGDRSDYVADLCREYGGAYLLSIGGASAMISNQVKTCEVVAYEDLGTESVKKLYVEDLRVIVGIDTKGQVFQKREIEKYRRA